MLMKLRKILFVVFGLGLSIMLIIYTNYLQNNIPEQILSLNLTNLWIRSNVDTYQQHSFYSINYLLPNRIMFQTYKTLIRANQNLETTFQCIGPQRNQTCLFKNLYYINNTFWMLTTKKLSIPLPSVRVGAMVPTLVSPTRRRFYTYADLEEFVQIKANPIIIPKLTLHFDQLWLMNIGHALFDGLYPAYIALVRFPPRHLQPFRILLGTSGYNGNHSFSQDVYQRFAGLDTINASILEEMSYGRWFAFEEFVMGSGDMCQQCLQPNLQLPGGVELNGSRLFRDRMYRQHGLVPPLPRLHHSAERRDPNKPLKALIIDNKRFSTRDRIELDAAIDEINMYTDTHQSKIRDNQTKLHWPLIHVTFISYSQVSSMNDDHFFPLHSINRGRKISKNDNKMTMHLGVLKEIDIHITGPGTGQMYQTFLSDGSVNINLGGLIYTTSNFTVEKYTAFLEQSVTEGTPYIRGLYYPIDQRINGIRKEIVIKLIRQAAQLILNGFKIPVNPKDNLAPDGQLFIEMCELDKNFCRTVTERWQKSHFWCFNTWPETIIYENGAWSLEGVLDYDQNVTCSYNRTLLHQLRQKYNISFTPKFPRPEQTMNLSLPRL